MAPPINEITADGYDLQFGTNVLGVLFSEIHGSPIVIYDRSIPGHFYLTMLLLPALIAAAKSSPKLGGRVVNTSSVGHLFTGLDFNTFKDGAARKKMGTHNLYCQSKYVCIRKFLLKYGNFKLRCRVILCSLQNWRVDMAIKESCQLLCTQVLLPFLSSNFSPGYSLVNRVAEQ
jgi:hypothetical protein